MAKQDTAFPIASEELEPFYQAMIGKLWARAQEAKAQDSCAYRNALMTFWLALDALDKLSICIGTATFTNIAMNNRIVAVAGLIESEIGINPMKTSGWSWQN